MLKLTSLLVGLAVSYAVSATRHYDIVNNCPFSATIYINGQSQGSVLQNGKLTRDFPDNWSGFIYTNLNQGNPDGSGTTRAGFYGTSNYYYVVRDPNWTNVGVSLNPIDRAPVGVQ